MSFFEEHNYFKVHKKQDMDCSHSEEDSIGSHPNSMPTPVFCLSLPPNHETLLDYSKPLVLSGFIPQDSPTSLSAKVNSNTTIKHDNSSCDEQADSSQIHKCISHESDNESCFASQASDIKTENDGTEATRPSTADWMVCVISNNPEKKLPVPVQPPKYIPTWIAESQKELAEKKINRKRQKTKSDHADGKKYIFEQVDSEAGYYCQLFKQSKILHPAVEMLLKKSVNFPKIPPIDLYPSPYTSNECGCGVSNFYIDRRKARSIVAIRSSDNLCLARSLVLACSKGTENYSTLRNGDFHYQTSNQMRAAQDLIRATNIPMDHLPSLYHVPIYEAVINRPILVYAAHTHDIIYGDKKTAELIIYWTPAKKPPCPTGHFDFISNPKGFSCIMR